MGSLCSRSSSHSGGHQVLGGAIPSSGGPSQGYGSASPRAAAADAAERRLKSAQARGTNASNPNRGRLAAQLEATKTRKPLPEARQEERLVVRYQISRFLFATHQFPCSGISWPVYECDMHCPSRLIDLW
ncbi:hypothetical protein BJ138DRAFT_1086051 [Hygrophoropsis aurantiaca]|uniref:Uncharacterized protein n=1 Tax=Hygrophoropsis aurantiaca TaxID=72124 RepID=A0ACB8ACS1_9AGAM|nr:hypothetical protein BJ138DRAFT_1086051 [Hygrophoropsis aurantiaca]